MYETEKNMWILLLLFPVASSLTGRLVVQHVYEYHTCDSPQFDLIFVHGLDGNGTSTFGNMLEKDWIKEEFPNCRILSLDFDAGSLNWWGSVMNLEDRSLVLMNALLLDAIGVGRRPIFFIAHSLGGLAVKKMLMHARDLTGGQMGPKANSFLRHVRFVTFYGTPHLGAAPDMLSFLSNLVGLSELVIDDLAIFGKRAVDINSHYGAIEREYNIGRFCFYEKVPMTVFGIKHLIVPEVSAIDRCDLEVIPVQLDHTQICKPQTKGDVIFQLLMDKVRSVMREAPQFARSNSKTATNVIYLSTVSDWKRYVDGSFRDGTFEFNFDKKDGIRVSGHNPFVALSHPITISTPSALKFFLAWDSNGNPRSDLTFNMRIIDKDEWNEIVTYRAGDHQYGAYTKGFISKTVDLPVAVNKPFELRIETEPGYSAGWVVSDLRIVPSGRTEL